MRVYEKTLQGRLVTEVIAGLCTNKTIGRFIKDGEARANLPWRLWSVPKDYVLTTIRQKNCTLELLESLTAVKDKIILNLHGGGYSAPMNNAYRRFAYRLSRAGGGMPVVSPDYRVAPEHPFPAALEDAVLAYRWILRGGWQPEQIVLAGESAGGGLALALCHYLKEHGQALPGALLVMSPWTDLTLSGDSYVDNFSTDIVFGNTVDTMIFQNWKYVGKADSHHPYVSPLFGDFSGFPPALIQVSDREMLYSDALGVAQKLQQAGSKVRLSVYEGMFHLFQVTGDLTPESRMAWHEVKQFLAR